MMKSWTATPLVYQPTARSLRFPPLTTPLWTILASLFNSFARLPTQAEVSFVCSFEKPRSAGFDKDSRDKLIVQSIHFLTVALLQLPVVLLTSAHHSIITPKLDFTIEDERPNVTFKYDVTRSTQDAPAPHGKN